MDILRNSQISFKFYTISCIRHLIIILIISKLFMRHFKGDILDKYIGKSRKY